MASKLNDDAVHLFWGMTLLLLSVILYAILTPLIQLSAALTTAQILILIFLGQLITLLPLINVVWRYWQVINFNDWIAGRTHVQGDSDFDLNNHFVIYLLFVDDNIYGCAAQKMFKICLVV